MSINNEYADRPFWAGDKVNWHTILEEYSWDRFLVMCWNCKSYTTKTRSKVYHTHRCIRCRIWNRRYKRDIGTLCWMLGLNIWTVRSRLTRGFSLNKALYFIKIQEESFKLKDYQYLYEEREKNWETDVRIAEKAELKFKTSKKQKLWDY